MSRTLVIGFGNIDRADDGVAYHVVNHLRRRLGKELLPEDETGLELLGGEKAIRWEQNDRALTIDPPSEKPASSAAIVFKVSL